jgi:hypothetical protein
VFAGPAFLTLPSGDRELLEAKLEELANERPIFSWLKTGRRDG